MFKQFKSTSLLLIIGIFSVGIVFPEYAAGQQNRGETRKERKARQKQEKLESYFEARKRIVDSNYVIPFDKVLLGYGTLLSGIRRDANFLKVEGDIATFQFRSGHAPRPGLNTLGGYTLKGKILNFKMVEKEKKHKIFITFTIAGNLRNKVSISLNGSGHAFVELEHPQAGRIESFHGELEPPGTTKLTEGNVF